MILEQTTDTASGIKLTTAARWRLEQINAFMVEGLTLANSTTAGEGEATLTAQFEDWKRRVRRFLSERWDSQHAETFLTAKKIADGEHVSSFSALLSALEPTEFVDKVLAKTKTLQRFKDELTREMLKEYA